MFWYLRSRKFAKVRKLIYVLFLLTLAANAQDSVFVDCYGTEAQLIG